MNIKLFKKVFLKIKKLFKPADKFTYVAMGDSTVEGIGSSGPKKTFPALVFASIKQEFKHAKLHNLGRGGAKISDVISSQLGSAIQLKPDLVTISVGANDLRNRTKLKQFRNDLSQLIEVLKRKTDAKVIVNNIPDLSHLPSIPFVFRIYSKILLKRFNQIIQEQTHKSQVILVDLYSQSKLFANKYPEFISSDGLHPSDTGYALWANTIITQIKHLFLNKQQIKTQF